MHWRSALTYAQNHTATVWQVAAAAAAAMFAVSLSLLLLFRLRREWKSTEQKRNEKTKETAGWKDGEQQQQQQQQQQAVEKEMATKIYKKMLSALKAT